MTRRAFTLIEVLVALALLAALSGALLAFLDTLSTRRAAVQRAADHTTGVGLLFDQVERAALACVADADGVPGIAGTRDRLTLAWRAVGAGGGGGNGGSAGDESDWARTGDLRFTELAFDAPARAVSARRWASGQSAGGASILLEDVGRVRFRYFDEGAWRDSFDSLRAGRLPRAIEVAVWLGPLDDEADALAAPGADTPPANDGRALDDAEDPSSPRADEPDSAADELDDAPSRPADRLRVFSIPDAAPASPTGGAA